ncbi:MAG: hypothetical protein CMC15_05075 [Flavobacteriaceae bacterium]|nr:hypothetical protein [Flavobacteriaceae bacterium]MAY53974.1 hypothetical protein [Flavobacteriaceae bacterium]
MKRLILLLFSSFLIGLTAQSQVVNNETEKQLPLELVNDPYVFVDRANMEKSAPYEQIAPNYFTKQVNIDNAGNNIVGDAANEPSLAIDPTNPQRIVMGWRQFDNINSNFRQAGYGYSTNGGYNWKFPGVLEPGNFRSDPVLDFDNQGNFYYNSLRGTLECDVFAIRDGGVTWGMPVPANGGDKQWMTIDKTGGPSAGHNYSYWNKTFTTFSGAFTRSTDDAMSFEACENVPSDPFWGTLTVDTDANLYLVGTNSSQQGDILVLKSTNAKDPNSTVTFGSPTVVNLDGSLGVQDAINPQGLKGQLWIDIDRSGGPGRDNVYVLGSVERASSSDPADVMFAKSTDGGVSFSPPVRINTDVGEEAHQWFGTMSVAPNGRIDVVWLDTRGAPAGTFQSVLYYSFSEDQGTSWSENIPISDPFNPKIGYPQQQKMGDYFDMKSDNEYAHVAWCATFTGGQDVYYTKISPQGTLDVLENSLLSESFMIVPNPVRTEATIRFNASGKTEVRIYDVLGREIALLVATDTEGLQQLIWNRSDKQGSLVKAGVYFVKVVSNGKMATKKMVIL